MTSFAPVLPSRILETLLVSVPSALFVLDADGRVIYANALAASLVRRNPEAVLGCDIAQEFGHLLSAQWDQACQTARSEQRTVEYELHNVALAGWFRLFLTPVEDNLVIHVKDTTEVNRMMQLQQVGAALAKVCHSERSDRGHAVAGRLDDGRVSGSRIRAEIRPGRTWVPDRVTSGIPRPCGRPRTVFRLPRHFPPCEAVRTGEPVFLLGDALDRRYVGRAEIRSTQTRSLVFAAAAGARGGR